MKVEAEAPLESGQGRHLVCAAPTNQDHLPEFQMMDLVHGSTALEECSDSRERDFPDRICS
jgi:hypothetical protein